VQIIRVSALNAIAVATRMVTALVLNKLLATFVGPSGYAVIGQFQNIVALAGAFASGATGQGVVRYTAEFRDDRDRLHDLWRTAGTVTCAGSALVGLGLIVFSGPLAQSALRDRAYQPIIVLLAIGLVFLAFNGVLLAIINGRKDTRLFVRASVAGSMITLAFTIAMMLWQGLKGALVALAINQSLALAATMILARREPWLKVRNLFGRIDMPTLRRLGRYVAMAAVAAIATPVAQLLIRRHLIGEVGLDRAGLWEAMNRLSAMYMLFFTSTLSLYYLPRIAEIRTNFELRHEVGRTFAVVTAAVSLVSLMIYLLRNIVVQLLFDSKFLPMIELFIPQLIGDTLKLSSWTFAYVMIGRGMTTVFIASEVACSALMVGLTFILMPRMGFVGASVAYALTYVAYFVFAIGIFRWHTRVRSAA